MAFTKIYSAHGVSHFSSIYHALLAKGIYDAGITLEAEGYLVISSASGDSVDSDSAVIEAVAGGLHHNKSLRIAEVQAKSNELTSVGVATWDASAYAPLSKADAESYYTDYEYLVSNPATLNASQPYTIYTLDGRVVQTYDILDIKTLADDAVNRMIAIYTSTSDGEIQLIRNITGAAAQVALDLIIDNRG